MQDLITFLIQPLLTKPDAFEITESEGNDLITYSIRVADEDIGSVIGKEGKIIRAIRATCRVRAMQDQQRVNILLNSDSEASFPKENY